MKNYNLKCNAVYTILIPLQESILSLNTNNITNHNEYITVYNISGHNEHITVYNILNHNEYITVYRFIRLQ